jgi:hypothetical protein
MYIEIFSLPDLVLSEISCAGLHHVNGQILR